MKKIKVILAIVIVLYVAFGFWGFSSSGIDEKMIIDGMIISGEQSEKVFTFTLLESEKAGQKEHCQIKTSDFESAKAQLKISTASEPFFGQMQYILLGEAFDFNRVHDYCVYFSKYVEVSPNIVVFRVSEEAEEYILENSVDGSFIFALSKSSNKEVCTLLTAVSSLTKRKNFDELTMLDVEENNLVLR